MQRFLLALTVGLFAVSSLDATPTFSRKYELGCSTCHTIAPSLNEFGRQFERRGEILDEALEIATKSLEIENIYLDPSFPLSFRIQIYPLEWHRSEEKNDTASSSFATFTIPASLVMSSASRFSKYSSARFRFLLDRERGQNRLELNEVSADIHPLGYQEQLNLRVGIQSPFYFTSDSKLRVTRASYGIFSVPFPSKGALTTLDQRIGEPRAGAFAYGFISELFYYDLGVYLKEKGFSNSDFYGRAGFTPMPSLYASLIGYIGKAKVNNGARDKFSYVGGEIEYSGQPFHLSLLVLSGKEEPSEGERYDLLGGFIEGGILMERSLLGLRYDFQTSEDYLKLKELVPFFLYRLLPNLSVGIEYKASAEDFGKGLFTWRLDVSF